MALSELIGGQVVRSYYFAGSQQVALRVSGASDPAENGVFYFLHDHLGSTSLTTDSSGNKVAELRYMPWGESRPSGYAEGDTPTSYRYTGQWQPGGTGLYFYRSRWYDPLLGRFVQPDTIVPDPRKLVAYDRYAYANNSPLVFRILLDMMGFPIGRKL